LSDLVFINLYHSLLFQYVRDNVIALQFLHNQEEFFLSSELITFTT